MIEAIVTVCWLVAAACVGVLGYLIFSRWVMY